MERIITHKTYVASGDRGEKLMEILEQLAAEHHKKSISRLLIYSTLERWGYDPKTLERKKPKP